MNEPGDLDQQLAQDAAEVIRQALVTEVERVDKIPFGVMTHKFVVQLSCGPRYVVRFYPRQRGFVVNYEPDVVARCAEVGVPVPDVIVDSRTGPPVTLPYMGYRMIEGVTLAERLDSLASDRLDLICEQLTDCVSRMRQLKFQGFGELLDGNHAHNPSWKSFVQESFHEGLAVAQKQQLLDSKMSAKLTDLGRQMDRFSRNKLSEFIWGDVRPQNILVDNEDHLAGLLDFEGALAGDPLLTLGYGYAALGNHPFFNRFADCWPDEIDWPQVYFYSVLRLLRIAKYAGQPLPTGHPRAALTNFLPGFESALNLL